MEWHVWDFPDNIRVYFKDEFRLKLYRKLKEICKTRVEIARRLKINEETIRLSLYLGHRRGIKAYTSVKIIKEIVKNFGPQLGNDLLNELEKNVVAYRSWNGWNVINPILPIKESPGFYSVVFHMIGDGNASTRHSPYYANKCKELIDEFINDLQIFGNVETKLKIREDDLTYVRFPKAITDILSHLLKVKFVRTNDLPKRIFKASVECKIEAIKAFIDDEGCVSTSFCIIQKSKNILLQFKRLLELVDIKTGKICNYSGIHQIYISTFSYRRFENLITLTNTKKNRRLKAKIKNLNY